MLNSVEAPLAPSAPEQAFKTNSFKPPSNSMSLRPLASMTKGNNVENGINKESNSNLLSAINFSYSSKPLFFLHDGSVITYATFEKRVLSYDWYLRNEFGIRKGDRIAAQVTKSTDSIALYLATLRIGAIYVPLNTDYKLDEIHYFLTSSTPSLFVCRLGEKAPYESLVQSINNQPTNGYPKIHCSILDEFELASKVIENENRLTYEELAVNEVQHVDVDDLAAICYTSGTTGKPKGAMISHGNLLSNAKALCETWRITEMDVLLHALPIYHVHGLFVAINTVLLRDASLIFLPRFDADVIADWLSKSTMMMGVPTYYTRLLQCRKLDRHCVSNVRLFISGSAPLLENTWNEFKERTGHEILERYGMTEGQMVCSNPYDGKRKPGTVGRALPLVTVRIRNGGLEYNGPNLFKGYWRMPEKTREDFTDDGYFISGDLAELDEDGYVRILGRSKDLIITGGLNVYPKEVENVIDALSGVAESSVIGVGHPDFGEAVVAVVVLKMELVDEEIIEQTQDDILHSLKEKIAGFKVPKRVILQKQLPRNVMGKVQKNVLRERYQHIFKQ